MKVNPDVGTEWASVAEAVAHYFALDYRTISEGGTVEGVDYVRLMQHPRTRRTVLLRKTAFLKVLACEVQW